MKHNKKLIMLNKKIYCKCNKCEKIKIDKLLNNIMNYIFMKHNNIIYF